MIELTLIVVGAVGLAVWYWWQAIWSPTVNYNWD